MRRFLVLGLLLAAACGREDKEDPAAAARRREEAAALVAKLDDDAAFAKLVELGETAPLLDATAEDRPLRERQLALLALGRIGGPAARDRLLAVLATATGDAAADGPVRLYAAAGLTMLEDPGTAIDLLLNLSTVNPNDNIAALGNEGTQGSYYTLDAQLCDALLALGLWGAEEDLVEQMKRRAWIRVLIDAHAALRRHTGLDLPFRYNGSYADRDADAEAWRARLRATRASRYAARPFAADDARFKARVEDMLEWLRGKRVNERFIAQKVVLRLGPYAVPFLVRELASDHRIAQRQAALMLGRIADPEGAPALRKALGLRDADARAKAIEALRKLADKEALPLVRERLGDDDAGVRVMAADFVGRLGGPDDAGRLRVRLQEERAPAARTALLCGLLRLGDREVVTPLCRILVEGEQHDREAALAALEEAAGKKTGIDALAERDERQEAAVRLREWLRPR